MIPSVNRLARISHQAASCPWILICHEYVMIIRSLYRYYRLRLMRSLRPSLDATLRAAIAVQIGCPADLSRLSFSRQRARAHCAHPWAQPYGRLSPCKSSVLTICPSTVQICLEQIWTSVGRPQGAPQGWGASTTAMLSVAGTRWREKSGAIFASPGEKSGLAL